MSPLLIDLIIQVIAGAFGGIVAGAVMTNYSLGTAGNMIAGAVGGGGGGFIMTLLLPSLQNAASAMDWGAFLGLAAISFVAGAILTLVAAVIRDRTA